MKKAIKKLIFDLATRLNFSYHQYKLQLVFSNQNVSAGEGVNIDAYFSANLPAGNFKLSIGNYTRFKKYCHILLFPNSELSIGEGVFFNNYCSINCLGKISIGDNTMFGEGVKLYDHNHSSALLSNKLIIDKDNFNIAQITIGKNCWIGTNVTILKGVTIGDNVIIGANCLIYKSVPANTVVKMQTEYIVESNRE